MYILVIWQVKSIKDKLLELSEWTKYKITTILPQIHVQRKYNKTKGEEEGSKKKNIQFLDSLFCKQNKDT